MSRFPEELGKIVVEEDVPCCERKATLVFRFLC